MEFALNKTSATSVPIQDWTSDPSLQPPLSLHLRSKRTVLLFVTSLLSHSVMSNSLQTHGLQPIRHLCPCDFSGKNTGASCHFLLQGNLPDPGIKPMSPMSPALKADSLPSEPSGKPVREALKTDVCLTSLNRATLTVTLIFTHSFEMQTYLSWVGNKKMLLSSTKMQ